MVIEVDGEERQAVVHALTEYLSNLREEIVKTERHDWRVELHREKDALLRVIDRLRKIEAPVPGTAGPG
jgi:hypothetical protein